MRVEIRELPGIARDRRPTRLENCMGCRSGSTGAKEEQTARRAISVTATHFGVLSSVGPSWSVASDVLRRALFLKVYATKE